MTLSASLKWICRLSAWRFARLPAALEAAGLGVRVAVRGDRVPGLAEELAHLGSPQRLPASST
jgi:hypothetical protein